MVVSFVSFGSKSWSIRGKFNQGENGNPNPPQEQTFFCSKLHKLHNSIPLSSTQRRVKNRMKLGGTEGACGVTIYMEASRASAAPRKGPKPGGSHSHITFRPTAWARAPQALSECQAPPSRHRFLICVHSAVDPCRWICYVHCEVVHVV
jgi:hypothetical protein